MKQAKLSILIPTLTERSSVAESLFVKLEQRIGNLPVELLMLRDNRWQNIGGKRNQLLRAATGEYITFLDDDDELLEGYFELVLPAIDEGADVICYDQDAIVDGLRGKVVTYLGNAIEAFKPSGITRRPPWHWCAWRRELACAYAVPQIGCYEDTLWLRHLWAEAKSQTHIDAVLHRYNYSSDKTTTQK